LEYYFPLLPLTEKVSRGSNDLLTVFLSLPGKHLEPLLGGKTPVELLTRTKEAEHNTKLFQDVIGVIKASGVRVPSVMPSFLPSGRSGLT
jgi:hypothetical protein